MNIKSIKQKIEENKGKEVEVKLNIGRNKYEYFTGKIKEIYPFLFTIEKDNEIKSFSYSDVLTKTLVMKFI